MRTGVFSDLIRKTFFQLSPTHNIWGSPSSDEKNAATEEKEAHPVRNHLDHQDGRKLYSPVLEVICPLNFEIVEIGW